MWFARGTDWRSTYLKMAVGVGIGFVLRIGANQAIARGDYLVGSIHDLAWIVPWLCYAWAAMDAPASPARAPDSDDHHEALSVSLLVVPALLIPLIGYSVLNLESGGDDGRFDPVVSHQRGDRRRAGDRDAAAGGAGVGTAAGGCAACSSWRRRPSTPVT